MLALKNAGQLEVRHAVRADGDLKALVELIDAAETVTGLALRPLALHARTRFAVTRCTYFKQPAHSWILIPPRSRSCAYDDRQR